MNDEIKYWLEGLDDLSFNKVLDYITNLQQEIERQSKAQVILDDMLVNYKRENERLKELNAELKAITKRPTPIDYAMIQKRYEDYKSRCEKAIEYMKKNEFININNYWEVVEFYQDLLNILQNGSDEEC